MDSNKPDKPNKTSQRSSLTTTVATTSINSQPRHQFFTDAHFGGIFARTVIQVDPESDLFMSIAQRAYQEHERSLIPCVNCGRNFFPDRVKVHERSCAGSKKTEPPKGQARKPPKTVLKRRPQRTYDTEL